MTPKFLFPLFFCFLFLGQSLLPEGVSTIVWGGEYFLLGTFEGHIVRYDGKEFSLLQNFKTPISDIEWNGKQWLIGGLNLLAIYDGKSFTKISEDYEINEIFCNEKYCLLYSSGSRLLRYDGNMLEDLTANIKKVLKTEELWVKICGNGEYWLIFTTDKLLKYNGNSFLLQNLPVGFEISSLAWNGKYWLLGGKKLKEAGLSQYDGNAFAEVVCPKDIFYVERSDVPSYYTIPLEISWNGKYWLANTGYSFVIYDGSHFEKVEYAKGPYTHYWTKEMMWNGKYWLISYDLKGTEMGALGRFEDKKLEWLPFIQSQSFSMISSMSWNGDYWLIGTYYYSRTHLQGKTALLKYDGDVFSDLTGEFYDCLGKSSLLEDILLILFSFIILIFILYHLRKRIIGDNT